MLKKWAMAAAILGWGMGSVGTALAWGPQTGIWSVTAEKNGKPGRGFNIDVQDDTLVMQVYAYERNDAPTFYLTSGKLVDNRFVGTLNKYRGGRYVGSGDLVGQEDGNEGQVRMRFVSGVKGYIQFPGEPEKEISRFLFGEHTTQASLRGIWMLTTIARAGAKYDTVDYFALEIPSAGTANGTGTLYSKDYEYSCEHLVKGANAGLVLCVRFYDDGSARRANFFHLSVKDGEGYSYNPAQSNPADDNLHVKRVTNTAGDFTGMYLKSAPVNIDPERLERMRQTMEAIAQVPANRALLGGEGDLTQD